MAMIDTERRTNGSPMEDAVTSQNPAGPEAFKKTADDVTPSTFVHSDDDSTAQPPVPQRRQQKNKVSSLLGKLRIVKASPSKAPLPNEVVIHATDDENNSNKTCQEHEEIEESLETSKKVLRRPSRFTFDIVPSMSESEDAEDKCDEPENVVNSNVSGLSILDDTHRTTRTCFQSESKEQATAPTSTAIAPKTLFGEAHPPTKLDHRIRTNSTSAISDMSACDIFGGGTTTVYGPFTDADATKLANHSSAIVVAVDGEYDDNRKSDEGLWFPWNLFSFLLGGSPNTSGSICQ